VIQSYIFRRFTEILQFPVQAGSIEVQLTGTFQDEGHEEVFPWLIAERS
jgi:hypothetical protein